MAFSSSSPPAKKYPFPTDVNVGNFVPVKLSQTNYSVWKPLMLRLFKTYGLLDFIDGDIPDDASANGTEEIENQAVQDDSSANVIEEIENQSVQDESPTTGTEEIKNQDNEAWKRSDALLGSWILGTLSEDLLPCVVSKETAKEMWEELQEMLSEEEEYKELQAAENVSQYMPLYKAAIAGDWESASDFLAQEPEAVGAFVTGQKETALFVAAANTSRGINFVKELVELMKPEHLATLDCFHQTALHIAAMVGNIEAANLMVNKNEDLPNVWDEDDMTPIHVAALWGQRKMFRYLLKVTKEDGEPKPFEGEPGVRLVRDLISSGFYEDALSLAQRYPKLACMEPSLLRTIARDRSAFLSGRRLNSWQRFIYSRVPMKLENFANNGRGGDVESLADGFISVRQKLYAVFWKGIEILVPYIKHIRSIKLMHHTTLQLVKYLCKEVGKLDPSDGHIIIGGALRLAAEVGAHEVVEEIFDSCPKAAYIETKMKETVFHVAIVNRQEKVFNLIYQFYEELRPSILMTTDASDNRCLHLAGFLKSEQKLNIRVSAAGAALQMQRELQWFKEVEKLTLPQDREFKNNKGKTPIMVFTETHEDLVKEGERWMKDTANSCTIVAALIATVVFAAAITVPGGNNNYNGHPIFFGEIAFVIFAISDALALFSSTSSVLMFLSILTARYSQEDFFRALPKRLIIGLATLFLSIISMMIAFVTTLYLVFGDKKAWILIPGVVLAFIPVILFAFLQFPLLWDMIKSTYGPSIFRKQSDRIFYS